MSETGESKYEQVFGDTFALYNRADMDQFIEPFKIRFQRNGLDPNQLFAGKKCLDAGCGNGRGALFMLSHGAAHVECVDFSEKNVESTRRFLQEYGFQNARVQQASLEEIPFAESSFDFVWCNGVLMHTAHPNRCLTELGRILKIGGRAWFYVYGAGGVYWRIIFHLRRLVQSVRIAECIALLRLLRYETRYVAEFIDDWHASFLRTYTHADMARALGSAGFSIPDAPLAHGMEYDSSHRRSAAHQPVERDLMGEGDLRYLLTKVTDERSSEALLSEDAVGSDYSWPEVISREIDPCFERLERIAGNRAWLKISAAAKIQRELRILLYQPGPFQLKHLQSILDQVVGDVDLVKNL